MRAASRVNALGTATIIIALIAWQASSILAGGARSAFAAPSDVAVALVDLAATPGFWSAIAHTAIVVLVSWVIASILGSLIGLILGSVRPAWTYGMASVDFLRSIPATAVVPVVLLILGPTTNSEFAVAIFVATWPVVISAAAGARDVSERQYEVARQLELSKLDVFRKLVLPCAVPKVLSGINYSLTVVLVVVVLAEMLGSPLGVGFQLVTWQQAVQPASVWAYVLIAGLLGYLLNLAFRRLVVERLATRWPTIGANA